MQSAFGVEHGEFGKKDTRTRRNVEGSAIAGAGATGAGLGLLAGGIPGAKADSKPIFHLKPGIKGHLPAVKAAPGGILGFRADVHQGGTAHFRAEEGRHAQQPVKDAKDAFYRGHNSGKIEPELKVMRGMAQGRGAANALLVGGAGATAYGLHRRKSVSKSKHGSDSYNAALAGAGTTGAVAAHAVPKFLDAKKRNYEASASRNVDEAGKLVPSLAGRHGVKMNLKQQHKFKVKNGHEGKEFGDIPWPKSPNPIVSDGDIGRNPSLLHGVSHETAAKVGALRGAATQDRHFAHVLGNTAKATRAFRAPAAVAGVAGLGGLAVNAHRKKS